MGKVNERLRDISWKDYRISKDRLEELKAFSRQYKEKKKIAKTSSDYGPQAINISAGGGGGTTSSPTETAAIRHYMKIEKAIKDCRMIEEAAMWAAAAGGYKKAWHSILRSVTEDLSYDRLIAQIRYMPYTKTDFYAVRRAYFHRLDKLQTGETQINQGEEGNEKVGTNRGN